jgi:hypothetical protein
MRATRPRERKASAGTRAHGARDPVAACCPPRWRTDHEIDKQPGALMSDDVQRVIRRTIRFNWQGELIRALLRHPGVKSVLLHSLLR